MKLRDWLVLACAAGAAVLVSAPQGRNAAAQAPLTFPEKSVQNDPQAPLRPCSCQDLEYLQDFLANWEYGRDRMNAEADAANAAHITSADYNIAFERAGQGAPVVRHNLPMPYTDTSRRECPIDIADTRRAAPCKEIYDAIYEHEMNHKAVCEQYWNDYGRSPTDVQTASEVIREEAIGYQIAIDVLRRATERILERTSIEISYNADASGTSRVDHAFSATLSAFNPAAAPDGKVEWLGRGTVRLTDIAHPPCTADDTSRMDTVTARTTDFRTVTYNYQPTQAYYNFNHCTGHNRNWRAPAASWFSGEWTQYLMFQSQISDLAEMTPGIGAGFVLTEPVHSSGTPYAPSYLPWPPRVGHGQGDGSLSIPRHRETPEAIGADDREPAETYVDEIPLGPMQLHTSIRLVCPAGG